jgi:hypothetical protein
MLSTHEEMAMKRIDFLKSACGCGLGLAGGASALASAAWTQTAREKECESMKRFKDVWIASLMENLEKTLDEKSLQKLMNTNGRSCAARSTLRKTAESCRGDVAKWVKTVGGKLSKELCRVEGNTVYWGYPRCYCELVASGPERLPDSYCLCSAGWVQEMFEIVAGHPVKVEIVRTIKRGAPDCRFIVRV